MFDIIDVASFPTPKESGNCAEFLETFKLSIMFFAILVFSGYTLFYMKGDDEESDRIRDATKSGLIAFIIALLAYLDLKAAPFFIVWLTSYYLQVA